MKTLTTISTLVLLNLALAGCYESGSETTPPPAVPLPLVGVVDNGKTYFESNCSACHSLGVDYTPPHFGASNLAQKQDMIATNMSDYDPTTQLMTAFFNVPDQRVVDLKAFIISKSP